MRFGQRSRGRPISSARATLARAMGCLASRPRVDDPADTSRASPSDPNARASPSASVRPGTAPAATTHRRRGARNNLRVRVPGDDDDGESSGGDDPDAVRAIVMVQSPDIVSNAAASTMRASRGRSSLYESTSRAVAGPREETRASTRRGSSSSSSSSAAARSLPGSVGSRCGGGEGSTTPDAIELERATREVREACAAVAATCAATATKSSSSSYSSRSSASSLAGSSYSTGSSIRDDPRAPYRRDLAAVELDVIAAVARLRDGAGSAEERAPAEVSPSRNRSKNSHLTLSVGVEDPSPSDAIGVGGYENAQKNAHPPCRPPRSIARVGTLPTSARRAAAAELVRKAMRRYEASGRRGGSAQPAGGDERVGGGPSKFDERGGAPPSKFDEKGGGGVVRARPGAPRRVTPIQF